MYETQYAGDAALIWLRVSTGSQGEESQAPDCLEWCDSRQYEIKKTLTVHGKSAYKGAQDADWQKVINYVRTGLVKVVVIWKVDRLDRRNMLHAVPMVNAVLEAGGRIEFATQPYIDLTTMPGRMAFGNMCEIAYEESKIKSDRVTSKHAEIRANGALTGRPPWGYISIGGEKLHHQIAPTEEGRVWVRLIFERVADGQSLLKVARWLNAEGITTNAGKQFHTRTLWAMIRRRTYMGMRQDAAGNTIMLCEPLVDAKLWLRANKHLDNAPSHGKRPAVKHETALLTSALFCDRCHIGEERRSPMYRIMSGYGKSRHPCYRCSGVGADRKGCGNMVALDATDIAAVNMLSTAPEPWTELTLIPGSNHDKELARIKLEMGDIAASDRPDDEIDAELDRLRREKRKLTLAGDTPDRWEEMANGETVGEHFLSLDHPGRRAMILDNVKFYAVAVKDPQLGPGPMLRMESRLFTVPVEYVPEVAA